SERAVVQVVWKVFAERFNKSLVIFSRVEFFCSEKLVIPEFPCSLQHFNVKEFFEFCWDVFEECKNAVVWMLVSEGVEYEAVFGYKGVSIHRNPNVFTHKHTLRN